MAIKIAKRLEIIDFKKSNGWLRNFIERLSLSQQFFCGELEKVYDLSVNDWLSYFEEVSKYFVKNIFNMVENGSNQIIKPKKCNQKLIFNKRHVLLTLDN